MLKNPIFLCWVVCLTAPSELFVEEDVQITLERLLRRAVNVEVPRDWWDIWTVAEFPSRGKANVFDGDRLIGTVEWTVRFEIVEDYPNSRGIEAYLYSLKFTPIDGEEPIVWKDTEVDELKHPEGVFYIYFKDLTPKAQKRLLAFLGVDKPEEENLNVFPIATVPKGE